jgi:hypothetical protein
MLKLYGGSGGVVVCGVSVGNGGTVGGGVGNGGTVGGGVGNGGNSAGCTGTEAGRDGSDFPALFFEDTVNTYPEAAALFRATTKMPVVWIDA